MRSDVGGQDSSSPLREQLRALDGTEESWEFLMMFEGPANGVAIGALIFAGLTKLAIRGVGVSSHDPFDIGLVSIVFFLMFLGIAWIYWGQKEVRDLFYWLRTPNLEPKRPLRVFISLCGIAGFFGVLMYLSDSVHSFLFAYALYLLLDMAIWALRRGEIREAVAAAGATLLAKMAHKVGPARSSFPSNGDRKTTEIYLQAIDAIKRYNFEKPHIRRLIITLIVTLSLYLVSIQASCSVMHQWYCRVIHFAWISVNLVDNTFEFGGIVLSAGLARSLAYLVFLANIATTEYILSRWRRQIHAELREARTQLSALGLR